VSDTSRLRANSFVDLYGTHIVMRRGHSWRSLKTKERLLTDVRYIPLLRSDIARLARADTAHLTVNRLQFDLPASLRSDYQELNRATPDSLHPDTTTVRNFLTVYHSPDTPPQNARGRSALVENIHYPEAARREGIEGKVIVQFVVTTDGTPTNFRIERGPHPLLYREAVRTAESVKFRPGRHR